jgi:hypothetical protein
MYWSPPTAVVTRFPTTSTSQVTSGGAVHGFVLLAQSAIAIPVDEVVVATPGLPAIPHGSGARAKTSCHDSAFAGKITMVSLGMVTTWLLTVSVPPE